MSSDSRRIVLARRARFLSAALVGIAGCAPDRGATPPRRDDLVIPPIRASTIAPEGKKEADPASLPVDTDGDGIADLEDACPDMPGQASDDPSRHGCPQVIVCLSVALPPKITFPPNGTKPGAASSITLDDTANLLKQRPQLQIEIEGHTDSLEPVKFGQDRAEAVSAELVRRGIAAGRITTTNAGSAKPIAPNNTVQGRTQNRRVELKLH